MSALLEVAALSRRFGGLLAVDALGFSVTAGEIVGLLGPNGSGKTTVLNLISGAIRPDSGHIRFQGQSIDNAEPYRIAMGGIARVGQIMLLQPFAIVALAWPVNGEPIDVETILFAAAVVTTVLIGQRMRVARQ